MARRGSAARLELERQRLEEEIERTRDRYGVPSAVQLSRLRWYREQIAAAEEGTLGDRAAALVRMLLAQLASHGHHALGGPHRAADPGAAATHPPAAGSASRGRTAAPPARAGTPGT